MDVVIPIVFPDYLISVNVPSRTIDLIPWVTWDNVDVGYKEKWSDLGHAGVLFINGRSGLTKYYEYGRYDPLGSVRRLRIPDVIVRDGKVTENSLKRTLHKVAMGSGQGGRIQGVYIEVQGGFEKMLAYALRRAAQNGSPSRRPYDLLNHNCVHFVKGVVAAAGVTTPWMIDPRPNSYIGEFRDDFRDLDYAPKTQRLTIEPERRPSNDHQLDYFAP